MPSIFRGAIAQVNRSDLSGRRVWKGTARDWWDPNNVGLSAIGAYRAINSIGTPWGGGPANYAASLVNNVTPGVNDLVEGNGAVPWAGVTGWGFVQAAAQWFDTNLLPANDQSWSIFVQYAGVANLPTAPRLVGMRSGAGRQINLFFQAANRNVYLNGGAVVVAPALLTGNVGVAGNQGYRNGVADGGAIGVWAGASGDDIYIGCYNNVGVAAQFITADIESVAIYNGGAAAVQAEAAAIVAAMAAL